MYLKALVTWFFLLILSMQVLAAENSNSGRLSNSQIVDDLVVGGLDEVCSALGSLQLSLPCNPASLSDSNSSLFIANVYVADDYEKAQTYRRLLDQKREVELLKDLFENDRSANFRGGVSLWYRGSQVAFSVTPYRLRVFSAIRNTVLPKMKIALFEEREFRAQYSHKLTDRLSFGLNTRLIDRKFIVEDLNLFSALVDSEQVLQKSKQTALVLEPGLVYQFKNVAWSPMISSQIIGYSFVNRKYDAIETRPAIDIGLGVQPLGNKFSYGALNLGINYRYRGFHLEDKSPLSLGVLYQLGLIESFVRLSEEQLNIGVVSAIDKLRIGILMGQKLKSSVEFKEEESNDIFLELSYLL